MSVVETFADAVLALDSSVPTGTYIDMSANLPVCDPEKINVPTLILRGQYDGIASFQDLAAFFEKLAHPDKQFVVMQGIAHTSTRSKRSHWTLRCCPRFTDLLSNPPTRSDHRNRHHFEICKHRTKRFRELR
jgi:pimeloyl-ACP methyl ester carboxylesterase